MTRLADQDISGRDYVKKYAKQMLKNSLFLGVFQEKRFVESLGSYRDVINICQEETDFIENLLSVLKKIDQELLKKPWIGITGPNTIGVPVGYCLWVDLPKEVFGKYWYKVKTVEFFDDEIRLKLEVVRPFQREYSPKNLSSRAMNNFNDLAKDTNLSEILQLTFKNVKHCFIFIFLLIGAIVVGTINIVKYLLEYFLLLMKETSNLIKAMTPIIINFINLIGKALFGFYQMIIALFQDKSQPQPVYNSYINFDPEIIQDPRQRYNKYFNKGLPYPNQRVGPTIRPICD